MTLELLVQSFDTWARTYAKMFGVIAAVIVLGSWLVQNLVLERAKSLRDALSRVEEEKDNLERGFHTESKMLEIYQVAASARRYANEARRRGKGTFKDALYDDTELLERTGVTRDFAYALQSYAAHTSYYLSLIEPPPPLRDKVKLAYDKVVSFRRLIDERHDRYEADQRRLVGETINPNTITREQYEALSPVIRAYREDVDLRLAPQFAPAANNLFRAYDELFAYGREVLAKRQARARIVQRLQIALYILGSILAIYGSYLQARPEAKVPNKVENHPGSVGPAA